MSRGFGSAQRYALDYMAAHMQACFDPDRWTVVTFMADAYAAGAPAEEAAAFHLQAGHNPFPRAPRSRLESMRHAVRVLAARHHVEVTYVDKRLCARINVPR